MASPDVAEAIERLERRRQALVDGPIEDPRLAQMLNATDQVLAELREEELRFA